MPDDGSFNPFAAAGLVHDGQGNWSLPSPDGSAPASAPPVAGPAAAPAPATNTAVIDVGPSYNPAAPAGTPGSEVAPSAVSAAGAAGAAPVATPALDDAMARLRTANAPTVTVHAPPVPAPSATVKTGADLLAPQATVPASSQDNPFAAAGLVQDKNGNWTLPQNLQASGGVPEPASPPPPQQEPSKQPWYQPLAAAVQPLVSAANTMAGGADAGAHAMTMGLDEIVSPLPAAIARSMTQGIPFTQAYDQVVQEARAPRQQFATEHPYANAAVNLAGGAATGFSRTGAGLAPLFAGPAAPGASLATNAMNYGRNIGMSILLGGAAGAGMTDGDVQQRIEGAKQGAELGGVLGAAAPAIGKVVGGIANRYTAAPFSPESTANRVAGDILTTQSNGAVPTMEPSPIPGMPLNVAQASGNPELSALVDARNAADVAAMRREQGAQNQAVLGHIPGARTGTGPEDTAAAASSAAAGNIKGAQAIISTEERRLWNKPSLSKPNVSTETSKRLIADDVKRMERDTPGLADAYSHSSLPAIVKDLNALPEKAAANEINSISSRFRAVARNPGEDDNVRLIARNLANVAQDGIWQAPEVAGAPARTVIPPRPSVNYAGPPPKPVTLPAVKADPDLKADLQAARAFTKRESSVMGHAAFDNILRRNSRGNETGTPGTALNRFFDFSAGVERPGAIKNVSQFLDDIKGEWSKLAQPQQTGSYDPAAVQQVKDELIKNSRDFIMAKMIGRVSSVERDLSGDRNLQMNQITRWLDTNSGMIKRSGMFTQDQIDALGRVRKAAEMIQRSYNLGRPIGSPTYSRLASDRFLDAFIPSVPQHVVGTALGAAIGYPFGDTALGAILGSGLETSGIGQRLLKGIYDAPRTLAIERLDQAIRDPQIAHDLMMKATAANAARVSGATKRMLLGILATVPAGQAMRAYGPGTAHAAQSGAAQTQPAAARSPQP